MSRVKSKARVEEGKIWTDGKSAVAQKRMSNPNQTHKKKYGIQESGSGTEEREGDSNEPYREIIRETERREGEKVKEASERDARCNENEVARTRVKKGGGSDARRSGELRWAPAGKG